MNFSALAKRAKETKTSKKPGKTLSKKRFGKSLANRAPAMFIGMLQLKVQAFAYRPIPAAIFVLVLSWDLVDINDLPILIKSPWACV
mgnify:CR=1 FL=1